jgi:hypothetical protein
MRRNASLTPSGTLRPFGLTTQVAAVLAVLALLPAALHDANVFDEGLVVTGAMLTRRGALPTVDYPTVYGPGQYACLALLFEVFGESLTVSRGVHLAVLAATVGLVCALTLVLARRRGVAAAVAVALTATTIVARPSPNYPALSAVLCLLATAWMLARWGADGRERTLAGASVLVGLAALIRWDFGIFGAVAAASGAVLARWHAGGRWRVAIAAAGPGVLLAAPVYCALLLSADPHRWIAETVWYPAVVAPAWRNLDFVGPAVREATAAIVHSHPRLLASGVLTLSFAFVPALVALATFTLVLKSVRCRVPCEGSASAAFLALLSLLLLNQMRVRPTMWQGFGALVVSLPLVGFLVDRAIAEDWSPGVRRALSATAALLMLLLGLRAADAYGRIVTAWWSAAGSSQTIPLPRAGRASLPEARVGADYPELVAFLRENTDPAEPIFSGVVDTSRLVVNDALVYFLAERPPGVRPIVMEAGLTNTREGQRELVHDLRRARVRTIVLWDYPGPPEPNRTATSNGVTDLNDYVRAEFREVRRFGNHAVWTRDVLPASLAKP